MVHPMRASYIGISQQWRTSSTHGNSVLLAQVTSDQGQGQIFKLAALATAECLLGFPEREMSAFECCGRLLHRQMSD
jgi:hypothetical protein